MKLNINSKDLLKVTGIVGACVKPKNTMPILDNLLFLISDRKLTIIADNLEIRSQIEVAVDCDEGLKTCIPYKLFSDILKGFPNTSLELTFTEKNLNLKSSSGDYNIPLVNADEFPKPKELTDAETIKLNGVEFAEALKKAVLFSERESITNMHNILIQVGNEDVKIASTDGSVIYEYSLDAQGNDSQILISRDIARYLTQTVTREQEIELNYTDSHLLVKLENRVITAIKSQGKFPPYVRVFESLNPNKSLKIDKDVMASAIKRLYGITDQNNYTLVFDLKGDNLELSFNNDLLSYNAKETLKCEYDGEDITIGFNASYLMNMVSTLDEDIKMEFLQNDKPCLFYAENTRALVAPMKL